MVDHGSMDEMRDDDPMKHLSGLCDTCSVQQPLDRGEFPDNKHCPNCSANYTLASFGGHDDKSDSQLRVYLAHRTMNIYERNDDWVSFDPGNQTKGFMQMAIRELINSPLGKAVSQYGSVELVLELWDSVPTCIPNKLQGQQLVNELRRGIECSLIDFCSMEGAKLSTTNRKITRKRHFNDEVPDTRTGLLHS